MLATDLLAYQPANEDGRPASRRFVPSAILARHPRAAVVLANFVVPALAMGCLVSNLTVFGVATHQVQLTQNHFNALYRLLLEAAERWTPGSPKNQIPHNIELALSIYLSKAETAGHWIAIGFVSQGCNLALAFLLYMSVSSASNEALKADRLK